mgnify:CR=1 FL=1|jgi:hypothetical protein
MKKLLIILYCIAALNISAVIINVPSDYPAIQAGLNAADCDDTVLVASGTYFENIIWPPVNGIKLTGSGEETCIIDGSSSGSVITFDDINNIIDSTTVISNLTITNGSSGAGGGVLSYYSAPKFTEVTVTGNSANTDGGGLFCFNYSHIVMDNVTISNNTAGSEGGGINCDFTSNIVIRNSRIINNISDYSGGGLCIEGGSHPIISYTLFANNEAQYGGGIWSGEKGSMDMINCTIADNTATTQGGGYFSYYPTMDAVNSIFWNNIPDQIWENADVTFSDVQDEWIGAGNIDMDPLFEDSSAGNYHLSMNSPCIDAGNPDSPTEPDGTQADMGAFYYDQSIDVNNNETDTTVISLNNYPNPFNPTTEIRFQLSDISDTDTAEIQLFNIKGQLVDSIPFHSSTHSLINSVIWNAEGFSSGVYFCKVVSGGKTLDTKKMLLMK